MLRCTALFLLLLLCHPLLAEDAQIAELLAREKLQGTMVISALYGGQTYIHNAPRAAQRFPAASTFKIPNSLIALQLGVVDSQSAPFRWDGTPYSIANWNQDQTLESAFRVSCVWCYQQLARKVGKAAYRDWLPRIGYGELREPFTLSTFWLDGSLTISALEQVVFLKQVYRRQLPFSAASYDTLRTIMRSEQTADFTLYAKTGLAGGRQPKIGWYVGYVETLDDVWFFATNLDINDDLALPLRLSVTHAALRSKGVLQQVPPRQTVVSLIPR